jgi:Transport protein particle (TRAPP) component
MLSLLSLTFLVYRASDATVSQSAFAYLYSELVQYHQSRVASISELERRLESSGYGVGLKMLELLAYRSKEVSFVHFEGCVFSARIIIDLHLAYIFFIYIFPTFHRYPSTFSILFTRTNEKFV